MRDVDKFDPDFAPVAVVHAGPLGLVFADQAQSTSIVKSVGVF